MILKDYGGRECEILEIAGPPHELRISRAVYVSTGEEVPEHICAQLVAANMKKITKFWIHQRAARTSATDLFNGH